MSSYQDYHVVGGWPGGQVHGLMKGLGETKAFLSFQLNLNLKLSLVKTDVVYNKWHKWQIEGGDGGR